MYMYFKLATQFFNGKTVTSDYHVTTSCNKKLKPALSCGMVTCTQFFNGRTVTSDYHVTTSCNKKLKPALSCGMVTCTMEM